jgi:hypothetical protein
MQVLIKGTPSSSPPPLGERVGMGGEGDFFPLIAIIKNHYKRSRVFIVLFLQ